MGIGGGSLVTGIVVGDLTGDGSEVAELTESVWRDAYQGSMWYPVWDEGFCRWQLPPDDASLHVAGYAGDRLVGCFCSVPAWLRAQGRTEYVHVSDTDALAAFHTLARLEGILPALESSHAIAHAQVLARTMSREAVLLVNLSGRGDKDVHTVEKNLGLAAR